MLLFFPPNFCSLKHGWTPTYIAARHDHVKVLEILIHSNAKLDIGSYSGRTPAFAAAWFGHVESLALLRDAGADLNVQDDVGCSPASIAAR